MTSLDLFLNELAPDNGWIPSWDDVLTRAAGPDRESPASGPRSRRRVLVAALALLAIAVIPLVAVAASNGWWFLKYGSPQSRPANSPLVVKEGSFSGKKWELIAYPAADGLCWSLTFSAQSDTGRGSALACATLVGFPSRQPNPEMSITYLASAGDNTYPAWVAGPVVSTAQTVKIRLGTRTIATTTFRAHGALRGIRFYAIQTPSRRAGRRPSQRPNSPVTWVAGYDRNGKMVACLKPRTARAGMSPFTACR
jgi:hypothetical protein